MRQIIALVAVSVVLLAACGSMARSAPVPRDCHDVHDVPGREVLLLGEMHGSVEAPELIYQLACTLSKSEEVIVGLEIPSREQPLIDAYLASRGSNSDIERLTSSSFWRNGRDGRSSVAMLKLIEDLRMLKTEGASVTLAAFDDQPGTSLDRDVAIATGIRRIRTARPDARIIALMGNIHAMHKPMELDGRTLVPSGSLLNDLDPVSIFLAYPAGTVWACMPGCETQKLEAVKGVVGKSGFRPGAPMDGYTYTYLLPSITASPPAVHDGSGG